MRALVLLFILALLSTLTLAQNPHRKRNPAAGSSASSSVSRTAQDSSGDEYQPSSRVDVDHTPREPRPARQAAISGRSNSQAAVLHIDSESSDSSVTCLGTTYHPRDTGPQSHPQTGDNDRAPSLAPSHAESRRSPGAQPGANAPSHPPSPVLNPLDLDNPIYYHPPPDSPECVGRRYLLLNTAPPTLEFYARTDPTSNNTDIDTVDRLLDRTLHPRFVFDREERVRIFDEAITDIGHSLRRLELSTNAHFILAIGLPDTLGAQEDRLTRSFTSRVIDARDYYRSAAQQILKDFRRKIAETRQTELSQTIALAEWEEKQRAALEERRARVREQARREMELVAPARNVALNDLKRAPPSPVQPGKPSKRRKDGSQPPAQDDPASKAPSSSDLKPAVLRKKKDKRDKKGKGKADEETVPLSAAGGSQRAVSVGIVPHAARSDSLISPLEQDEEEIGEDDQGLRQALEASLKTVVTDEARRRNEPVASTSSTRLDSPLPAAADNQPGPQNALAARPRLPHVHRPDPILPAPVVVLLVQLGIREEFWPAIEVVWTTAPRATYPEALATVSSNCDFYLSAADIYSLAALLSRTTPPPPPPS